MAFLTTGAAAQPPAPCCTITSIQPMTGVVSAIVTATRTAFQFKVANAATLAGLKVGQAVYANL